MAAERTPVAKLRDQSVKADQTLTETWKIEYNRRARLIEASLWWPHYTIYTVRGQGDTVEEARLDLVGQLAKAIAKDENPYGDE